MNEAPILVGARAEGRANIAPLCWLRVVGNTLLTLSVFSLVVYLLRGALRACTYRASDAPAREAVARRRSEAVAAELGS